MSGLSPIPPASDPPGPQGQGVAARAAARTKLKPHPIRPHRPDEERQMLRRVAASFEEQEQPTGASHADDGAWDSEDTRPLGRSLTRLYRD